MRSAASFASMERIRNLYFQFYNFLVSNLLRYLKISTSPAKSKIS